MYIFYGFQGRSQPIPSRFFPRTFGRWKEAGRGEGLRLRMQRTLRCWGHKPWWFLCFMRDRTSWMGPSDVNVGFTMTTRPPVIFTSSWNIYHKPDLIQPLSSGNGTRARLGAPSCIVYMGFFWTNLQPRNTTFFFDVLLPLKLKWIWWRIPPTTWKVTNSESG